MSFSKLDYCQFLIGSQVNYTLTNLADHLQSWSHDTINRYLRGEMLVPRLLWENAREVMEFDPTAYVVFDDTVLDKQFGPRIEMTRRQWSGNEHRVINGIGLVSCLYVHPGSGRCWVLDYRIFDPDSDGKTKLDHVADMLSSLRERAVPFGTVLMDSWYAIKGLMLNIDGWKKSDAGAGVDAGVDAEQFAGAEGKIFYCPLKSDRLVDDSGGARPYRHVCDLEWSEQELQSGKVIKIRGFPKDYKVKLFRVEVSSRRTDWVVTNDLSCDSTQSAQQACAFRWKIEESHRELKQLTGIEQCQCRKARIQRNHIACALLVWTRLKEVAHQRQTTIYQVKFGLLHDYLVQHLKKPLVQMTFA